MKITLPFKLIIAISLFIFFNPAIISAQENDELAEMPEENNLCLNCHKHKYYSFYNEVRGIEEKKLMNPYFVIDTIGYLKGEHRGNSCTDCHSEDYKKYPHIAELKVEPKVSCTDCHDFEEIAEEMRKSVHFAEFGESFNCELCHDPHSNKLVRSNMTELVQYNNSRCLSCHNNIDKYQVFTSNENPELKAAHDWLPNQELHFTRVRCIECHTSVSDTAEVVHQIVPKEQAVHNCNECHSNNSLLRDKLYKHQNKQNRLYNAKSFILNDAYIIGANKNHLVNLICLVIFGFTIFGIATHTIFRIIKRK